LEGLLFVSANAGATGPDGPTVAMVADPEGHRIGILQEPN